jgi:hypothetical protein
MANNRWKNAPLIVLATATLATLGALSSPTTAAADPLPYGPDTCNQGFVWREAGPGDVVCVTPAVRSTAAQDNQQAGQRVDPNGAYGPNSCKQGFVWREAFGGDVVCVVPATRSQAASDNAAAASRKAANAPAPAPAAPAADAPCLQNPVPGLIPNGQGVFC